MTTGTHNPYFQVGLDVFGQRCLVLGGQDEAADKSARLVAAGANVVVISPNVTLPISEAAQRGELAWLPRDIDLDLDLEDTFLVMNTCRHESEQVQRIFIACRQHRILLNTYDEPDLSDFGMAALVDRGHLRISISSSNASPTLAGKLRRNLESAFDEEFVEFLEQLGRIRREVRHQITDGAKRRALLRSLVDGFHLQTSVELPPDWRKRLQQVMEEGDAVGSWQRLTSGKPGS
jgi:precorrin-2 dehydrogenase/sirohydrochlorin ferrochelatase